MSSVTLEALRDELRSFAVGLLRNELHQFKGEILADLCAIQHQQHDKIQYWEDIASPQPQPSEPMQRQTSPTLPLLEHTMQEGSCCGYEPTPGLHYGDDDDDDDDDSPRPAPPNWANSIAGNHHFKNAIIAIIIFSLTTFVVQTDYTARHWTLNPPAIFQMLECSFLMVFTLEIVMRISGEGLGFFCGPHHTSNLFDFFLVVLQAAEAILDGMHAAIDAHFIGALRFLRVARVLRVGRLLHLVPAMRLLFLSIVDSMGALVWIIVIVVLTTGSFAVVITQVVTDHKIAVGKEDMEEHQQELEEYFGNVGISTFMLYQTISDGLHWGELVEPLMRCISPWTACIMIIYSAFVTFALMNIVCAYFVETALVEAQEDIQKHMSTLLWEAFHEADVDHDREVTEQEFMENLHDPRMINYLEKLELTPAKAKEMHFFRLIDKDGSGCVNFHELTHGCLKLMGNAKAVDIAALLREFREECSINAIHCRNTDRQLAWLARKIKREVVLL